MSELSNQKQLIQEFLKEVKNKLPGWLKDNKSELQDVLSELETHIWEKSEEIAGAQEVQVHHIEQAIQAMGNSRDIAAEYKKRGTPKIWISKELFPAYLKTLGIVIGVIVGINIIGFIINVLENPGDNSVYSDLWSIFSASWGALFIVTVIFVALSVEGYLPEDFKKAKGRYQLKSIPSDKADTLEKLDRQWEEKRPKQVKPPLKRGELLVGGIIALIFGIIMLAQGPGISNYLGPEMSRWLQIAGLFTIIGGFIKVNQSIIDLTNYTAQRILIIMGTIVDLVFIPFLLKLGEAILSVPVVHALQVTDLEVYNAIGLAFKVVIGVSIFGTVIGTISNIYKVITLQMKFEEYFRYSEI
ncbi:MAG: hypothetical protein JW776_11295 [Candidatus Lokiarchaeota archaeon]|nr:hypothetical protein [Candidatus Lokiarchaeota archaeon]